LAQPEGRHSVGVNDAVPGCAVRWLAAVPTKMLGVPVDALRWPCRRKPARCGRAGLGEQPGSPG